jgi:hypothetical protein
MLQNYCLDKADNSINRSFLFCDNYLGIAPENFFTSLMKCV